MNYKEKLQDTRWQKVRLEVLQIDSWQCQLCTDETESLHIHHNSYEKDREPWEYPLENFITFCKKCHLLVEWLKTQKYIAISITKGFTITLSLIHANIKSLDLLMDLSKKL